LSFRYFLLFIITLASFVSCNECEDCDNLYHEPTIRVVFLDSGRTTRDSVTIQVTSFNGRSDLFTDSLSEFSFPIEMDTSKREMTYNLSYIVYEKKAFRFNKKRTAKDSLIDSVHTRVVDNRSFTINYRMDEEVFLDRFLFRANIKSFIGKDGWKNDTLICSQNSCYNSDAIVYMYE
jgi:hypothetical protein